MIIGIMLDRVGAVRLKPTHESLICLSLSSATGPLNNRLTTGHRKSYILQLLKTCWQLRIHQMPVVCAIWYVLKGLHR